ncbi:hypothetical protein K435DRAFT_689597 [Dendrothele bispora CBS 962.96]|uniref:Tc1-like transposase DDE domain-containing protein n=1 Tax=Dendrothele bispora (strain CBS 962.96) TaxID=1314807 RepID=A0A4S8L4U6_DENBC|nr:hypothetical protein K435DRAFT_689597 [Dendrothele bispora CBS 962.96]
MVVHLLILSKHSRIGSKDHAILLFQQPASSPSLNPIEPVWHKLKAHDKASSFHPLTAEQLI